MNLEKTHDFGGINVENHMLLRSIKNRLDMRRRFTRHRSVRSTGSRPRVQHTPAEYNGTIATKILALRFLVIPNSVAGTSLGTTRSGGDRSQEVNNGSEVGNIGLDLSMRSISNEGVLEVGIAKIQRQHGVPVVGTDPIPTSSDVDSVGLQASMRKFLPGWVLHWSQIPFSAETPRSKHINIKLRKFKMAKWRDGDYLGLFLFNRSSALLTVDHTSRFYEYK